MSFWGFPLPGCRLLHDIQWMKGSNISYSPPGEYANINQFLPGGQKRNHQIISTNEKHEF